MRRVRHSSHLYATRVVDADLSTDVALVIFLSTMTSAANRQEVKSFRPREDVALVVE